MTANEECFYKKLAESIDSRVKKELALLDDVIQLRGNEKHEIL